MHRVKSEEQRRTVVMSGIVGTSSTVPWWREPTKDQWYAYFAAWLGWTLDAFDFTIFLLIMIPISQEFGVPLTAVTAVFAVTLWLRLIGATAAGWLADPMGPQGAADGLDPVVFGLQPHRRFLPKLSVSIFVQGIAWHRDGR
jgi:MFS family permease